MLGAGLLISTSEYGSTTIENTTGAEFKEIIEVRIADRLAARAAKNWAESDRIRGELAAMGVVLKDNKDGTTTWELKR